MPRTFYCFPNDAHGQPIIGTSHRWTVEDSPLPLNLENTMQNCPFHDGLPNNEGPFLADDAALEDLVKAIRGVDA